MNIKKIAIVGLGVVGRATGKGMAALGHDVIFSNINLLVLGRLEKEGFKSCNIDNPEKICAGSLTPVFYLEQAGKNNFSLVLNIFRLY